MRQHLETAVSALLGLAASAFAVVLVHREFFQPPPPASADRRPVYVSEWREFTSAGHVIGDTAAPVKIVEFVDIECPFCRLFHKSLSPALKKYDRQVAYTFIHLPLPMHRFARPGARAVECAHSQGRLLGMLDAVFEKQDSLGLKTWASYAKRAGVLDTVRFSRCMADTAQLAIVEAGAALARRYDVSSTPTTLINGWRFVGSLTDARLDEAIKRAVSGKDPF